MSFCFTKGNQSDLSALKFLFKNLKGLGAGDKGYISKQKAEELADQGLEFVTKLRKNMKKKILTPFQKFFLSKRGIIETVIEQLKSVCQIEHSRHRSPTNFISNLLSTLAAYILRPRKPSLRFDKLSPKITALTSS